MYGPTQTLQKFLRNSGYLPNLQLKYIRETVFYIRDMILKLNTLIQTQRMHKTIFASQSKVAIHSTIKLLTKSL